MDFVLKKEHSKVIFVDFFNLCSIGTEAQKFQKIFRKLFKDLQSPKMVGNGFCAMKEHSKLIFC